MSKQNKSNQFKIIWLVPILLIGIGIFVFNLINLNLAGGAQGICGDSNYQVVLDIDALNFPPNVEVEEVTWSCCTDPNPYFSWIYSDDDGDPQESYQLQADNNSDFSSPEVDTGTVNSSTKTYHPSGEIFAWDTDYYWRVKVKDNQGNWSEWSDPIGSFRTKKHAYPNVDFSWTPSEPSAKEPVQFTDETTYYNGGNSWFWTFESAVPATSVLRNPVATFSAPGNWDVNLKATDADGYQCELTLPVEVAEPLPEWKEVPPK